MITVAIEGDSDRRGDSKQRLEVVSASREWLQHRTSRGKALIGTDAVVTEGGLHKNWHQRRRRTMREKKPLTHTTAAAAEAAGWTRQPRSCIKHNSHNRSECRLCVVRIPKGARCLSVSTEDFQVSTSMANKVLFPYSNSSRSQRIPHWRNGTPPPDHLTSS